MLKRENGLDIIVAMDISKGFSEANILVAYASIVDGSRDGL